MSHLSCAKVGWERRNFQGISNPLTLSKLQLLHFFWGGFSQMQISHKCNINTQYEREQHLCKLPELLKNQAQILWRAVTANITNFSSANLTFHFIKLLQTFSVTKLTLHFIKLSCVSLIPTFHILKLSGYHFP